jgi:hypothetical protein
MLRVLHKRKCTADMKVKNRRINNDVKLPRLFMTCDTFYIIMISFRFENHFNLRMNTSVVSKIRAKVLA